jgi:hypothetical protein
MELKNKSLLLKEFFGDIFILLKFVLFLIYSLISLWFKNLFIPSKYLYKKVDNDIVLITGAGNLLTF